MHAKLTLTTQQRGAQTTLKTSFASPPLKLLTLPAQSDGMLRAVQMSSSPGLLSGDVIETSIELAADTSLSLYTQAFTRVLSMYAGDKACQNTKIVQHSGSRLCYLPHPLVLHEGSSLFQRTEIELDNNCELLYGEIIAAGRVLRGEKFAFQRLSSLLTIALHGQDIIHDNIQWQPEKYPLNMLGQMEHYTHQLNIFYVHTAADNATTRTTIERVFEHLDADMPSNAARLWGISQAHEHALCLRALSDNAQDLQDLLRACVLLLQSGQGAAVNAAFLK